MRLHGPWAESRRMRSSLLCRAFLAQYVPGWLKPVQKFLPAASDPLHSDVSQDLDSDDSDDPDFEEALAEESSEDDDEEDASGSDDEDANDPNTVRRRGATQSNPTCGGRCDAAFQERHRLLTVLGDSTLSVAAWAEHRAARRAADAAMTPRDEAAIDADLKRMVDAANKGNTQQGISVLHAVRRSSFAAPCRLHDQEHATHVCCDYNLCLGVSFQAKRRHYSRV